MHAMRFFKSYTPIFRKKTLTIDIQRLPGVRVVHWQIGNLKLYSTFYTQFDQACILWGLLSAVIFGTAQFLPLNWGVQAILWSAVTLAGTVAMVVMTQCSVRVERLSWVVYCWVILMLGGLAITDLSIFLGWGEVLMHICDFWLGLIAFGYLFTGLGMQSRAMIFIGLVHLLGISILPCVGAWQFLTTGAVMLSTLLLLAELRWDMPPSFGTDVLTGEQNQFSQEQYQI